MHYIGRSRLKIEIENGRIYSCIDNAQEIALEKKFRVVYNSRKFIRVIWWIGFPLSILILIWTNMGHGKVCSLNSGHNPGLCHAKWGWKLKPFKTPQTSSRGYVILRQWRYVMLCGRLLVHIWNFKAAQEFFFDAVKTVGNPFQWAWEDCAQFLEWCNMTTEITTSIFSSISFFSMSKLCSIWTSLHPHSSIIYGKWV